MSGPRVSPDIIERLRVWPAGYGEDTLSSTIVGSLMKDAADEIERLRHDNAALTLQVSNAAKEVNCLHGAAQAPVLSDAWCDAFLKATGEWIEAHEAETECGVPMECEITQADADEFNAQAREAIRKGYAAAVTSTGRCSASDAPEEITGVEMDAIEAAAIAGNPLTTNDYELAGWARQWHWNDCAGDQPVDPSIYFRDMRMLKAFIEKCRSVTSKTLGGQHD